jgi:2-dehydro-3-deoxygalactonokinase
VILAIESGTTMTRAWALSNSTVLGHAAGQAGARDIARARDRDWLLERVRDLADEALGAAAADWSELEAVIAFGMITSELGLEELPHLVAPVSVDALAAGMQERDGYGRLPARVFLVPGVRNPDGPLESADFMRGEETEAAGLLSLGLVDPPLLYVSTGSHTKFVEVDADGRIASSATTLSGELLWALHRETILVDLIDPAGAIGSTDRVDQGARSAAELGLSRTLFSARLRNLVGGVSAAACSDFVHGAVAMSDLVALRAMLGERPEPRRVVVSGSSALAGALRHLLAQEGWAEELHATDRPLGALGAQELYRLRHGRDSQPGQRRVRA